MTLPILIPGGVPLSGVPGLSARHIRTLNDLWIDTAQELVGIYGTTESLRSRLAASLGIFRSALDPVVHAAQRMIPLARDLVDVTLEMAAAETEYSMGALLEDPEIVEQHQAELPPYDNPSRASLPTSHSLLSQLPPLRNQGRRGTCVAHAVLSLREQLEIGAGAPLDLDLSEQYVYWWCKEHDGMPVREGTYLSVGMRCLSSVGAPLEALWPYVNTARGTEGQGPPPDTVVAGDPAFRIWEAQEFKRTDIAGMKSCLVEGRSIALALPMFESALKSSAMARWGKITLPLPGEPVREGHAVTLVGYQDDDRAPGGGYFLVRNSWQPWAWSGVWAHGYGYLPYAYVARHANAMFSARRLTGAALYLADRPDASDRPDADAQAWTGPDVWLRQHPDAGAEPQTPAPGRENAVYVHVLNRGPACAYRVVINVICATLAPGGQPQTWTPIGRLEAPMLWPGDTVLGPLMWTPPNVGPFAFFARAVPPPRPVGD